MRSHPSIRDPLADDRSQRGSALLMALLLGAVVVLLGSAFLVVSQTDRRIAANEANAIAAFAAADAGLNHAIKALEGADVDALLGKGGALFSDEPLGLGAYTVTVTNNSGADFPTASIPADAGGATSDTDGYLVLTSTGTVANAERSVSVVVAGSGGSGPSYPYAIWGDTQVLFSGGGWMDCYDSSAGPFDPSTATSDASAFSNVVIELSGGSYIYGNGYSAGTIKRPEYITGKAVTGVATESYPTLDCPTGGYTPASDIPSGDGITYKDGELTVGGGNNITLSVPPTEYYFAAVTLSGGSTLTLDSGGQHVDMYVENKFVSGGGGLVNVSQRAQDFTLSSCGIHAKPERFEVSGGGSAYFVVYAPDREVKVTGSGDLWGSVIGYTVEATGGSRIHCDKSLSGGTGGGSATFDIVQNTWREIF